MKTFTQLLNDLTEATLSDKQHADKIRAAADKHHDKNVARWKGDSEMTRMFKSDHKKLHAIADHVAKGEYHHADAKIRKLDTEPREVIPAHQYNHISKKAG